MDKASQCTWESTLVYVVQAATALVGACEDNLEDKIGSHFPLSDFYSFATAPCLSKCTWESALAQVRLASRMICNNIGQRTLILDSLFSIPGNDGNLHSAAYDILR